MVDEILRKKAEHEFNKLCVVFYKAVRETTIGKELRLKMKPGRSWFLTSNGAGVFLDNGRYIDEFKEFTNIESIKEKFIEGYIKEKINKILDHIE